MEYREFGFEDLYLIFNLESGFTARDVCAALSDEVQVLDVIAKLNDLAKLGILSVSGEEGTVYSHAQDPLYGYACVDLLVKLHSSTSPQSVIIHRDVSRLLSSE